MVRTAGDTAALAAYVPRGLLASRRAPPEPRVACATQAGAVLIADVCGFTRLASDLGRQGRSGAEALTGFLDQSLGPLVDAITACGGDVVAFAGDAVLAVWEGGDDAVQEAAACALDRIERHRALRAPGGVTLPLRMALGAGEVRRLELGGEFGRWVHLVAGEAVEEALRGDALRIADHVIASARVREGLEGRLGDGITAEPLLDHFALRGSLASLGREVARPVAPPGLVESFAPQVVIDRLATGPAQFVAEFRNVTVAFLSFDPAVARDEARIQRVVTAAQRTIELFEGVLHQVIADDHGLTVIAAFGLPSRSHDDDPSRAIEFAATVQDRLGDLGVRTRAAVATGSVYCGDYGGVTRRMYGVVGDSMNRAAHLMAAAEPGAVVCDAFTRSRARRRRQLVAMPPLPLKGAGLVQPYLVGAAWSEPAETGGGGEVVGRRPLRRALDDYLARLPEEDESPSLLLLEGEAGIGKTTVLSDLHRRAREKGLEVAWSQGESIRDLGSFAALRPLVRVLGTLAPGGPSGDSHPGLLHAVLPGEYDADPALEALTPQTRLERLIELLRGWIRACVRSKPLLWIVEDAHWIDSASQSVLRDLAGSTPRFGTVLGQRPFGVAAAANRQAARTTLTLEPLTREETGRVLAARLGVSEVPDALLETVQGRAAGNPLFAEELVGALIDRGDVEVVDGRCMLRATPRALERVDAPPSLERLITSRVDRLKPPEQLTLKAASVLGRRFELPVLAAVRPDQDAAALAEQLDHLVAAGFLQSEPEGRWLAFRHPLFQEITYGLLVQAQRHILHRRAAEALEGGGSGEPGRLARLALHWDQAGDPERALPLLTRAADEALRHYANEEAVDLYERALGAREALGVGQAVDLERARIERNMGAAHTSLTRHGLAREHYRRAIRASGHAVPDGGRGLLGAVAVHLGHRVRRRLTGRGAAGLAEAARDRAFEAAYAMAGLAANELWLGDDRAYAHVALQLANVGDRIEPSPEAAGATSALGYLLGLTPFRRAGERDLVRALASAAALSDAELHVTCGVMYGMFLTAVGRPGDAIDVLRPASERGVQLEAGPWRHRSRFMLAEALLLRADHAEARIRFEEAAELSRHGEPHVVGFANALGALARLHGGDARGAIGVLTGEDGVEGTRRNESKLPLFASLGALAEVCALSGLESERGAAAAREAESLADDWSDTAAYFAGCFGHAGLLEWWLAALERGESAGAHVDRGLRRLRRFARRYPGAQARSWLLEGRYHAARGRKRKARRAFIRAAARARAQGLGREQAEAELRRAALEEEDA